MEHIKGKNKDGFFRNGTIEFRFSDRLSVFDRVIGEIPGRGSILAKCTRVIFKYLSRNNVVTALLDEGLENSIIQQKCTPLDFEFIMRNLLTGSALDRAKHGKIKLPRGMECEEYAQFPETYAEVSTKREGKDRYGLGEKEINRIMLKSFPDLDMEKAYDIFTQALQTTKKIAFLLTSLFKKAHLFFVDGKIEFGINNLGHLCLIDSFGPDEFRVVELAWAQGPRNTSPEFLGKEFIRRELKQVDPSDYDQILRTHGSTLISRYREVTERLKQASEQ